MFVSTLRELVSMANVDIGDMVHDTEPLLLHEFAIAPAARRAPVDVVTDRPGPLPDNSGLLRLPQRLQFLIDT